MIKMMFIEAHHKNRLIQYNPLINEIMAKHFISRRTAREYVDNLIAIGFLEKDKEDVFLKQHKELTPEEKEVLHGIPQN